jgi:hypothetical protein
MFHNEEAIPSAMNEISKHGSLLVKREYRWRLDFVAREEIIPLANGANIAGERTLFRRRKTPRWRTARTSLAISEYVAGEKKVAGEHCVSRWRSVNSSLAKSQNFAGEKNIAGEGSLYRWRTRMSLANSK